MQPTIEQRANAVFGVNLFVNRESGALCRVKRVDSSYAYLEILTQTSEGWTGMSGYSMPLSEYDTVFVEQWRQATVEDLVGFEDEGYRPPANAPAAWRETS